MKQLHDGVAVLFVSILMSLTLLLCAETLSAQNEVDVFELISEADSYFSSGELDKASEIYSRILTLEPDNIYALNRLAVIAVKKNDGLKARQTYASLLKFEPDNTFALYWLGILDLKDEKIDDAFSRFSKIIETNPDDSNAAYAHMFLGAIYTFRHQPDQAILELRKAREKADKSDVHYKLARAYHDAGMFSNAKFEYITTLKLERDNLDAIDGLGWIYYNEQNREKALALWQIGLDMSGWKHRELRENLVKAYNDMAMEQFQLNNTEEARNFWRKVLAYDSKNKAALHFLGKVK